METTWFSSERLCFDISVQKLFGIKGAEFSWMQPISTFKMISAFFGYDEFDGSNFNENIPRIFGVSIRLVLSLHH